MSESQNENPPAKEGEHKTPTKRTPSKRMSIIERAQRESEELIKNMGGSLDVEGGRRTRSSARGANAPSTPSTPPPAKKARTTTTTPRRGRQKKNELLEVNNEEKIIEKEETSPKKSDSTPADDVTDNKDNKKDQIENCTENDVDTDGKTGEKEKNSELVEDEAAATKPNSGETLESITEVAEAQDEVTKPNNQSAEAPAEPMATSVPEAEAAEESKPESVPEKKLEPVEPMEVDGSALGADGAKVKTANDSKDSLSADSAKIDNTDGTKTAEVHENSIEKSAEPTIDENKVGESKTGTDVCEPKISSPTSTGDVVAAQTCN